MEASTQLKSANPNHVLPNILFFVNHNRHRNVGDLREVIGVPLSNAPDIPCPIYPKFRNRLLIKNELSVVDYIVFVECPERGEAIVLDDYAKDFIKDAGKDEKWAEEEIWKASPSDTAYYFLLSESQFSQILKEKISSKAFEVLPKFV